MTTERKIALVESVWETYGLGPALAAVGLPKTTWYYHRNQKMAYADKYADVFPELEEIAQVHPEYGYRRATVELQETYHRRVNQRWCNGLLPIVDHVSKFAYGWAVGEHDDTELALRAWERAKQTFHQLGIPYAGMIMHHDQDGIFIGYEWVRQLLADGVRLSYTLNSFKDNPEMESFNGWFKEENHTLLLEAQTVGELMEVVDWRMEYYNTERCHSSIGYLPPLVYIEQLHAGSEE